ncbi:MAG: PD-(D/E)XK nuclease family transposase, partial [Bacteroidales bacterium]|nr:PD-(D/E)XK nuclease family transposase [Bacteroidales bacterium]
MGKYVDPFTDTGFKILFGQEMSKPLLIDFLNNLLDGKEKITD